MYTQHKEEQEQALSRHVFVSSVYHPDFKRLEAIENLERETEHQHFLVKGGRDIEAALDAGYLVLEIWVPEKAVQSLAWWEERTSSTYVVNAAKRAAAMDTAISADGGASPNGEGSTP